MLRVGLRGLQEQESVGVWEKRVHCEDSERQDQHERYTSCLSLPGTTDQWWGRRCSAFPSFPTLISTHRGSPSTWEQSKSSSAAGV